MLTARHDRAVRLLLALALGAGVAAIDCHSHPAAAATDAAPLRLIDQLPAKARHDRISPINGLIKPILPPYGTEYRFLLAAPPPHAQLVFSVGLPPDVEPVTERFEILLQPRAGNPVPLYTKELHETGWVDERIDLTDRDLNGATLIFRRTRIDAASKKPRGVWGNPMLLPGAPQRRPSLILISIDTLRADFTGPYGHKHARTSALDRLSREGTLFEQAYSPSTWTVPSHASLFYGMLIPEPPASMRDKKRIPADSLTAAQPLATILRDAGYLTAGFTGGGFLNYPFGLTRGFDTYFAFQQQRLTGCPPERFDGATVFAQAADWLRANHQRPFFLFVHTYDVHDRCPFRKPDEAWYEPWPALSPEDNQRLLAFYDGLIANTDQRVATLLDAVDELGLRDSTLVIVTSDHGEGFSEHGIRGHGCNLKPYEEVSRVPLLMRFPGHVPAGTRVSTPISLIDVAPTTLALLGLPPQPWMQGQLLPGLGLAAAPSDDRTVYVHCGDALAVRRGPFKLITSHDGRYADELYDLGEDPHERHAVADPAPDVEEDAHGRHSVPDPAPVRAQLQGNAAQYWMRAVGLSPGAAPPPRLDESTKERLRALGYAP